MNIGNYSLEEPFIPKGLQQKSFVSITDLKNNERNSKGNKMKGEGRLTLEQKAKTIRKTIGYCCENWNSSLPCQEECDRPFVWFEDAQKDRKEIIDDLRESDEIIQKQRDRLEQARQRIEKLIEAWSYSGAVGVGQFISELKELLMVLEEPKQTEAKKETEKQKDA